MDTLAKKLKELPQSPYQKVAELFDTNSRYVGMIARGERVPVRGKGLAIKKYLKEMLSE